MRKFNLILCLLLCSFVVLWAKDVVRVEAVVDQQLILTEAVDYHITSSIPLKGSSTIDIQSEDAWLFLDSIRPGEVAENYLSKIKVNGEMIRHRENARIEMYMHGAVIIPHTKDYGALTVYKGDDFTGDAKILKPDSLYTPLGDFDNAVSSFKLKRGYMATVAIEQDGTVFSRVFIADRNDIDVPVLQPELYKKISYIRTFSWNWPSKKGWCSASPNIQNELDLTHSTWYYTWSASEETYLNQEYVPIKQQYWWPGWEEIAAKKYVTHLLGYNEPDHWEQSDVSVDTAIEEWPKMMQSGLRLGTPATTDFNWLYEFMDKCEERNYRVDYVVIHAYWGGLSPQAWYNELKKVHDRTGGRPIWIKEWNNGANWTQEPWPEDPQEQQLKQLQELNEILNVFDTCSFVERYSIYNWVEDKRALVMGTVLPRDTIGSNPDELGIIASYGTGDQFLTPAGENYRDRVVPLAFNPDNEIIPVYKPAAPVLSATHNIAENKIELSWTDKNSHELVSSYVVQRKIGAGDFEDIYTTPDIATQTYTDLQDRNSSKEITYRIKVNSAVDDISGYSNEKVIAYDVIQGENDIRFGTTELKNKEYKTFLYDVPFTEIPVVVFGGQSYNNRHILMGANGLIQNSSMDFFRYKLPVWAYQEDISLTSAEVLPFLIAKKGNQMFGNLALEAGSVSGVRNEWVEVTFQNPFQSIPVVFVNTSAVSKLYPVIARVRNVTQTGFEVRLTREKKETDNFIRQSVNYIAIEQGVTEFGNKMIKVGVTENVVGELSKRCTISFGASYANPLFFPALQTSNDDLTSGLRYSDLTPESVTVFKQQEKSISTGVVKEDKVGFLVVENGNTTGNRDEVWPDKNSLVIYPTVTTGKLNLNVTDGTIIKIYNVAGLLVKSTVLYNGQIDVSTLLDGIYILNAGEGRNQRFVKVS